MLRSRRRLPLSALLMGAGLALLAPSLRAETTAAADPAATIGPIKFGELTIDAALELLERWTGRTILRPNALPATTLSLNLNQKITRDEARQALETLLTMNGIAVTPLGEKFLKVSPLNLARTEAPDFIEGSTLALPPSGRIAAKLFQLQFLRVSEFMPQIAGLMNPGAASPPALFEKANSALITDSVSNLQRIEALIATLDQPALGGLAPKFYKIHNTTASELVTKLQGLLTGASATQLGTGTIFQADDRTNQIILMSDARQHAFFDELIAKLDTAGESSTRQEVIPLKHASATEVATLLTTLVSGQNAAARAANQATQQQAGGRAGGLTSLANPNRNNSGATALQAGAQPGATPAGPQPAPGSPAGNAAAQAAARAGLLTVGPGGTLNLPPDAAPQQFSNILTVVPDERSNALVVSGTVDDMRLIKDLVSQLDVILAQVRIEVVIAEVTLNDTASSGIDALGLVVEADHLVGFSGNLPGLAVTNGTIARGTQDLSATLNLTTTPRKNNTNILSVPNIVTTHNKEATLFVGESRPVITSFISNGTVGNVGNGVSSNVSFRDIGIQLTVKPLIGHDGSVQLEIRQEVNDILGEIAIDGNNQPIIGSRTTESFVTARSGEIVVLGGLQRKTRSRTTSRLGGIPLLGDLLGARKRDDTRTDLVFFLRPYVLTNTATDNAEALLRLQTSPQQKDVQSALQGSLPVSKP